MTRQIYHFWPKRVREENDIPPTFLEEFMKYKQEEEEFPFTIFIPPYRWGFRSAPPKLIIVIKNKVIVIEKAKKNFITTDFLFRDIYHIEKGSVLLISWLSISGLSDGKPATVYMEFNTVAMNHFMELIDIIRKKQLFLNEKETDESTLAAEKDKFNFLINRNYKYMNFGRESILPGEKIVGMLLQNDYRKTYHKYFSKLLFRQHFAIVTDKELILIREAEKHWTEKQVSYGGIWHYIPLDKIGYLTAAEDNKKTRIDLQINLTEGESIRSSYELSQKNALEGFISMIEKTKAA